MKKTFDCLKMKAEIQSKIYEIIKDMSAEEELEYFHNQAQKKQSEYPCCQDIREAF